MKIATVFLVAVTVFTSLFLESSAAPNPIFGLVTSVTSKAGDLVKEAGKLTGETIADAGKLADGVIAGVGKTVGGLLEVGTKKAAKDIETVKGVVKAGADKAAKDKETVKGAVKAGTDKAAKDIDTVKQGAEKLYDGSENIYIQFFIQIVDTKIKQCNAAMSDMSEALEKISTKTADVEKLDEYLKGFKPMVSGIHDKLKKDATMNDPVNRKKMIDELDQAIKTTKEDVAKMYKEMQMDEVKKIMDEKIMKTIVPNAEYIYIIFKASLSVGISGDNRTMDQVIAECNESLSALMEIVKNKMNENTDGDNNSVKELYDWLSNECLPLVEQTHAKLMEREKGSVEERTEMAKEVGKITYNVVEEVVSFTEINVELKVQLYAKVETMVQSALYYIRILSSTQSSGS